jgi:hypothetical protein
MTRVWIANANRQDVMRITMLIGDLGEIQVDSQQRVVVQGHDGAVMDHRTVMTRLTAALWDGHVLPDTPPTPRPQSTTRSR